MSEESKQRMQEAHQGKKQSPGSCSCHMQIEDFHGVLFHSRQFIIVRLSL